MDELINYIISEKDIIEQLIEIDNDKMMDNISYEEFLKNCVGIIEKNKMMELKDEKILFVTEGSPYLTLQILSNIWGSEKEVVIFINEGYLGLNRWLMERYYEIGGNKNHKLDINVNYNKYINKEYKVIPIGEDAMKEAVIKDFYE